MAAVKDEVESLKARELDPSKDGEILQKVYNIDSVSYHNENHYIHLRQPCPGMIIVLIAMRLIHNRVRTLTGSN